MKSLILKSGIPLEVSVLDKLLQFDVCDFGEVEYERDGKIFSTDIHVVKKFPLSNNLHMVVNFVIECKYKTPNHEWFFMKFPRPREYSLRDDVRNEVFDSLFEPIVKQMGYTISKNKKLPKVRLDNFFKLKSADKGVEFTNSGSKSGSSPDSIRHALHQVVLASVEVHRESMASILECFFVEDTEEGELIAKNEFEDIEVISITIPIIVTTAKLLKAKENVSLETITDEEDVYSLLDEEKGILLMDSNYSTVSDFSDKLFQAKPLPIDSKLRTWACNSIGYDRLDPNCLKLCHPGYVYVISYEHFEELFSLCIENISEICMKYNNSLE